MRQPSGDATARNSTKKALRSAFLRLYAHEPYEQISVRRLCLQAPAARSTFYAYYRNLADLKAEIEDDLICGLLEITRRYQAQSGGSPDLCSYFPEVADYVLQHRDVNRLFLVDQPNLQYLTKWKAAIRANCSLWSAGRADGDRDLLAETAASAVLAAYTYWMVHPDRAGKAAVDAFAGQLLQIAQAIGGARP